MGFLPHLLSRILLTLELAAFMVQSFPSSTRSSTFSTRPPSSSTASGPFITTTTNQRRRCSTSTNTLASFSSLRWGLSFTDASSSTPTFSSFPSSSYGKTNNKSNNRRAQPDHLTVTTTLSSQTRTALKQSSSSSSSSTSRSSTTASIATDSSSSSQETTSSGHTMQFDGSTVIRNENYDIVQVDLVDQNRAYPIYIGTGYSSTSSSSTASSLLHQHIRGNKVLIVTNEKIAPLHLKTYSDILAKVDDDMNNNPKRIPPLQVFTLILPDGEEYKNMETLQMVLDACLQNGLDRGSTLIALGGGVIGDLVGFAAAIYQRGIPFIQIPTSLMAMVDSSVGGKTGINHPLGKNMIGAFYQPQCVLIDTNILQSLPDRELYSGIAEIIKYGLIQDHEFFQWQEDHMNEIITRQSEALRYAITRSCQNKAAVVAVDERESNGVRATLNLGHTFGHAIETGCGYGTYLHGEAVAIGITMATQMSYKLGWIDMNLVQRVQQLLNQAQLPVSLPSSTPMDRNKFLQLMSVDKKVANGKLRLILLKGELGQCIFTGDFDQNVLIETIDEFVPGVVVVK